jgi:hypothetical protein
MRGDQLARQWPVIRAAEVNPNGVTEAERAKQRETALRTTDRDLEAPQASGSSLYAESVDGANRWTFNDTFKFKIPPPFTLTELMSLYFYPSLGSLESSFKEIHSTITAHAFRYLEQIKPVVDAAINRVHRFKEVIDQFNQATFKAIPFLPST